MSESSRLRKLLKQLQAKLQNLGPTNRARWTVFSTNSDMSITQFVRRVAAYGIKMSPTEAATIWKAVGINTKELTYSEFVKLTQTEVISIPETPKAKEMPPGVETIPRPKLASPNSSIDDDTMSVTSTNCQLILQENRRGFLMKCLDQDPLTKGKLSIGQIVEIIQWFGIKNEGEISELIANFLTDDGEHINYIQMVDSLCNNFSPARPMYEPPNTTDSHPHFSPPPKTIYSSPPPKNATSLYQINPDAFYNENEDLFSSPHNDSPIMKKRIPASAGDDFIFGSIATSGNDRMANGPRRNLDPAIFGPKPVRTPPPRQRLLSADECSGARRVFGLTPGQIVELISKNVFKTFRSSRAAFMKWRGGEDGLTAESLRDGLARDCGVVVPLEDSKAIVDRYGGLLNMSAFTRMLSDGTRFSEIQQGRVQETEDEAILNDLAAQISANPRAAKRADEDGNGWHDIIMRCGSADEVARGLAEMGVRVSPEEIHTLASKLGKTGLADALYDRVTRNSSGI